MRLTSDSAPLLMRMATVSPFKHLRFSADLACEFFAVFSRFEFALKESGYRRRGHNDAAEPDWDRFGNDIAAALHAVQDVPLGEAVNYLVSQPPYRQVIENNDGLNWRAPTFPKEWPDIKKALLAVRIVRNNLFHGGKHAPHSPPGRDEKLIRAALEVLQTCIEHHPNLKADYETSSV